MFFFFVFVLRHHQARHNGRCDQPDDDSQADSRGDFEEGVPDDNLDSDPDQDQRQTKLEVNEYMHQVGQ